MPGRLTSMPYFAVPLTFGGMKYGIDVNLPGMVYGKVVTPPVRYGGMSSCGTETPIMVY